LTSHNKRFCNIKKKEKKRKEKEKKTFLTRLLSNLEDLKARYIRTQTLKKKKRVRHGSEREEKQSFFWKFTFDTQHEI
jgi:hypothetical protein